LENIRLTGKSMYYLKFFNLLKQISNYPGEKYFLQEKFFWQSKESESFTYFPEIILPHCLKTSTNKSRRVGWKKASALESDGMF